MEENKIENDRGNKGQQTVVLKGHNCMLLAHRP